MTQTILYIGGWGRSGSTILGNILNEAVDTFHVGEMKHIWHSGFLNDYPCGCGVPFSSCPVWGAVRRQITATRGSIVDPKELVKAQQHTLPTNRDALCNRTLDSQHLEASLYARSVQSLYRSVFRTTGCRIIVDSSKSPSYGFFLATSCPYDVRFIHLVRDPRASAFSWQRSVQRTDVPETKTMMQEKISSWASTQRWLICNTTMEVLGRRFPHRYLRIRYEDFVAAPQETAQSILKFAGQSDVSLPFQGTNTICLNNNHTVWGNPKRTRTGRIQIREDREWTYAMSSLDQLGISILCWPLLLYYGYDSCTFNKYLGHSRSSLARRH
jgi:hypothetical protein